MIKVFTKEKISKVIITHLFTREEINQYFDGNVFIDHPELNPQDYIVLDENNDFTHPTYDEELQAIREMTYDETKLLEVEPLIDGEYIEDGKLITVEYDEKLGYLKKAWNKETHIWYEGATEDELKTEYFRLINLYKATVFPGPYKWTDKLGEVHYQHSRPDKDVGLLETTISYLERHPEDIMLWQFSDEDEYPLTLEEAHSLQDAGVIYTDALFEAERKLKAETPNVKLTLEEFKEKFDTIYSTYIEEKAKQHSKYINKVKSLENTIEVQKVEIEKRDVHIVDLENQNKEMETLKKSLEEKDKKIEEILQKIGSLEKQDEIKATNENIQL